MLVRAAVVSTEIGTLPLLCQALICRGETMKISYDKMHRTKVSWSECWGWNTTKEVEPSTRNLLDFARRLSDRYCLKRFRRLRTANAPNSATALAAHPSVSPSCENLPSNDGWPHKMCSKIQVTPLMNKTAKICYTFRKLKTSSTIDLFTAPPDHMSRWSRVSSEKIHSNAVP